jgi:predicted PurR-regulated permease PerM
MSPTNVPQPDAPVEAEAPVPTVLVQPIALPASAHVALVGIFLIMTIASFYLARALILPLVLATLFALAASPLVRSLSRRGIPAVVTAVALVALLGAVAFAGISLLRAPISDMVERAPQIVQSLRNRFEEIRKPFVMLAEASKAVTAPSASETKPADTITVSPSQPTMFDWLLSTVADVGSIIIATLLLAPFLLASMETLKMKLIRLSPLLSDKKRALRVLHDIEQRVSRYLITVSLINFSLGTLIGIAMWVLGMPNPLLWGLGAALLNYVPYIGSATGIALTAAISLTIHEDLLTALLPPIAYAALNATEGTLVTPLIVGRRLSLSIVAILITLGLTTWMWGIIGTLIGVPLLVVIKSFCDEFPGLAKLGMFISAESESPEAADEATAAANTGNGNGVTARPLVAATRPDHAL